MMETTKTPAATMEKTNILILKCTKCGWSLKAPLNRLEINEEGFLCGRCFEIIEFATIEKDITNLFD
ncbi:MAG: hypothetical protein JSU83_12170 [Deltaproteobacteria bacterium]|nr:MAG: hypothetical protein JSU83_12170 [Deltaproteobacteria bacterium]